MISAKQECGANGEKRGPESVEGAPNKRQKTESTNPLQVLHQRFPTLVFHEDEVLGPPHNPTFLMSFELFGKRYNGSGRSKKQAKMSAAKNYLESNENNRQQEPEVEKKINSAQSHILKRLNKDPSVNPLMLLHELHLQKSVTIDTQECHGIGHADQRFRSTATLNGKSYEGYGASKKVSKSNAAAKLLNELYGTNLSSGKVPWTLQTKPKVSAEFVEEMGAAVRKQFAQICNKVGKKLPTDSLACVLMTVNGKNMQVVSLALGSGTLTGDKLNLNGVALNDCHAEVLARRGLISYLLSQLESLAAGKSSIFHREEGRTMMKAGIKFHLYSARLPCGACLTYSGPSKTTFLKRSMCLLTSKASSGEHTDPLLALPIKNSAENIISGKAKLVIMSCTDKLLRWQCIGLQGALLSHLIPPVYFDTLVFSQPFHEEHFYYTLCGRIESCFTPVGPYAQHLPLIAHADIAVLGAEPNQTCLTWDLGTGLPDLIDCTTGTVSGSTCQPSLSKLAIFSRFKAVASKLGLDREVAFSFYGNSKLISQEYQKAKNGLQEALAKQGLGKWVKKPLEQEHFTLTF